MNKANKNRDKLIQGIQGLHLYENAL